MERSLAELAPATHWVASRVDYHPEIDSTNLRAEALAREGAPEGTLVVADAQSAGRGRVGRAWFSPPGRNLYLSLVLRPRIRADAAHYYVFVGALAVADTAAALLGAPARLEIKWPNDVLCDGRKLSGVNLPATLEGERVAALVLGIGLNVNLTAEELPPDLRAIATSLRIASGRALDRVAVACDLLERLEGWIERLRAAGPAPILDAYSKWLRMRGSRVRVGGPGIAREVEGIAEGLGEDGSLLVRTPSGVERILAGDVELVSKER
jgi:BirA family biotin operon repressor/biotin-[acetyl-CoA-carboxylase] ligase